MNTLFQNALIVTMDDENPVLHGDVAVAGDKIFAVGECGGFHAERVVDASGYLLMPGLVNAHTHTPMTLLRCYGDDLTLQAWLFDRIFPAEERLTAEDMYWGTALACGEMLLGGTTAFADMYFLNRRSIDAVIESGMRAGISRALQWFGDGEDFSGDPRMDEALSLRREYHGAGDGRIKIDMAVHAVYTSTPAYLRHVAERVAVTGCLLHTHLSETARENTECLERWGVTPARLMEDCGLFDGPTLAAHCVHLTAEDMDILARRSVAVVHNPTSNLKLASGIAPIPEYQRRGIVVALGTDGAASNNNLNMMEELHLAALLHKGALQDPLAVSAQEALKMATVNGAKAMGLADTGMIKAGCSADLILIDMDKPHLTPYASAPSALAYSAQGADVDTVMVAGKFLVEKREVKTLDMEQIKYHARKIQGRILSCRTSL